MPGRGSFRSRWSRTDPDRLSLASQTRPDFTQGPFMKIFAAALATETNTFSPMPTDRRAFEEGFYAPAGQHPAEPSLFSGPLAAARRQAKAGNWQVVEGLHTF